MMPDSTASMTKHASTSCPCLYAVNQGGNSVTVYASGATANAMPIQASAGSQKRPLMGS